MESPIEVGEKLMELFFCWEKVVLNGFNEYSPSIVGKYPSHFARDQDGQSMFEQYASCGEDGMTLQINFSMWRWVLLLLWVA